MTLLVSSLDAAATRLLDEGLAGNVSRLTMFGLVNPWFQSARPVKRAWLQGKIPIDFGLPGEAVNSLY